MLVKILPMQRIMHKKDLVTSSFVGLATESLFIYNLKYSLFRDILFKVSLGGVIWLLVIKNYSI